jgi:DNA-binding response OmpR family regulator
MLTARTDDSDRILGLEMGADDYLVKPFVIRSLSSVRAVSISTGISCCGLARSWRQSVKPSSPGLIVDYLEKSGYRASGAANGKAMWSVLKNHQIDLRNILLRVSAQLAAER